MGRQQLLVLAILAMVAAGLSAWLVGLRGRDTFGMAGGDTLVWDVWRRDIIGLEAEGPDTAWRAHATGAGWQVQAGPKVAALPDDLRQELLDAVEEARRGERIGKPDLEQLGLVLPVAVSVHLRDGRIVRAAVGDDGVGGSRTYVRRDDGVVLAVVGGLGDVIRRKVPAIFTPVPGVPDGG